MISTDSSHKKKSKKRKLNETGDDEILEQEEQIAVKFKTKKKNVVDGEADDVSVTLTPDQAAKKRGGKKVKEGNPKTAESEGAFYQGKSSSEHSATKTSHRKKKSKDKSSVAANASVLNDSAFDSELLTHSHNNEEDSAVATKKKKKGKRDKTQNEEQSSVSYDDKPSSDDLPAVTSHRKKKSSKDKSLYSVEASDPVKKPKREKAKLTDESSLGVIDTDILQQAETNLGLPMVDKLEKDSVVHSLDTTSGEVPVKKKKKKRDKTQTEVQSNTPNEKSRNDRAIEYLRLWGSNRKAWKFNKMMQVQLLHIMYDKLLVSDEDFEILLLYLDGLKGKGREKTKESAKKILDEGETGTTDADKEERARQVYQMLS